MEEAERIAREEHGSIKLAVISGKQYLHVVVAGRVESPVPCSLIWLSLMWFLLRRWDP